MGENNGWVVAGLIKDGALPINSPLLYSKQSKYNPFEGSGSEYKGDAVGRQVQMMSYGIPKELASRYGDIQTRMAGQANATKARNNSSDTGGGLGGVSTYRGAPVTEQDKTFMKALEAKMTPANRLRTATILRKQILTQNPKADVTKLNQFIKENK